MSDELLELDSISYDPEDFWTEGLLYASLILKDIDAIFPPRGIPAGLSSPEYWSKCAVDLFRWLDLRTRDFYRQQEVSQYFFPNDRLPDVCGGCFFSFGLTVSGRYRLSCTECKGKEMGLAFRRLEAMHRFSMISLFNEILLAQLIYKYYSQNGDKEWELKIYNPMMV